MIENESDESYSSRRESSQRSRSSSRTPRRIQNQGIIMYIRPVIDAFVKIWNFFNEYGILHILFLFIILFIFKRFLNNGSIKLYIIFSWIAPSHQIEKHSTSQPFESSIRLDPENSQFVLFYQTKIDNEIKLMRLQVEELKEQAKNMYSIQMKSCMDLIQVTTCQPLGFYIIRAV